MLAGKKRVGTARWKHKAWVTCALDFKNRRRTLMRPGRYTELFFTDEAVALAAGHRPCAECRRADYHRFRDAFARAHPQLGTPLRAPDIDRILHAARATRNRQQITHQANPTHLPDGVFFKLDGESLVRAADRIRAWSFEGYSDWTGALPDKVDVLTPEPTVRAIRAGYVPALPVIPRCPRASGGPAPTRRRDGQGPPDEPGDDEGVG
jgi:hypothetical protein